MTETQNDESVKDSAREPTPEPAPPPLDLRVAEVLEAREHPNADRLLVLRVDLHHETRQLVAGLAGIYEPDALIGKRIVVVANLKTATLRGEVSEGMLLAAHGEAGVGLLLAPDSAAGTPIETARAPAAESGADGGTARITIDDFAAHDIRATPDGVTVDGHTVRHPPLVVDRDAWGKVK